MAQSVQSTGNIEESSGYEIESADLTSGAKDKPSLSVHQQLEDVKKQLKFEYKTKAYLALEDSDKEDYGIVKDTLGDILWTPGKGDVVGTWSISKVDNLIHISLLPAVEALYDRSVQIWSEYAARRKADKVPKVPGRKRKEKSEIQLVKTQEPAIIASDETKLAMNNLRARLIQLRD